LLINPILLSFLNYLYTCVDVELLQNIGYLKF